VAAGSVRRKVIVLPDLGGDQSVAGTDVGHDLPGHDLCVVQDTLAQRQEKLQALLALLRVIAVASMEQLGGPLINGVVLSHRPKSPGSPTIGCYLEVGCDGTDIRGRI
jgi:hypothetical protein